MEVKPSGRQAANRFMSSPRAALLVGVLLALVAVLSTDASQKAAIAAQLLCCVGAAIAVMRPVLGAALLGALLLVMVTAFPDIYLGMAAVMAFPIAVAVCAARGHRLPGLTFALWCMALMTLATSRLGMTTTEMAQAISFWLLVIFGPMLLGEAIWQIQRRSDKQRREQVLAGERQRHAIARDLHDTMAYATTSVVMKAEQARLRGGQDPQTLADLDYIAATARSATADLRTILAMLRDSGHDLDPSQSDMAAKGMPVPTRLEEVMEAQRAKLRAFDFQVNISLVGDPTSVPDRLFAALARALTEITSNITKHGDRCCEVSIMIDFSGHDIEAVLINTPRPDPADSGHRGLGLLGLREVVEAEGGSLVSGPMGNRWISHLTLPRGGENGV